jgi:uncharacterized protein (TIGR03067 family)
MTDLELLQGEWAMISMEIKGVESPEETLTQYKLTIEGDNWIVTNGEKISLKAVMKIDETASPGSLDLIIKVGQGEMLSLGIYKVEGDTLTFCRTGGYRERPKEFKTTPDAYILAVWKRVTK